MDVRTRRSQVAWFVYLAGSLLLLEVVPSTLYPAVVIPLGLLVAVVAPPPVRLHVDVHAHDLGRLAGLYAACVALFILAFQGFGLDNVAGLFLSFAAAMLVGVGGALLHVVVAQGRPLADLGLSRKGLPGTLALGLVLASIQVALTFPKVSFGPPDTWVPLLAMAVTVGLFEAVFFRGYVLAVLEPMFGTVVAVLASAVLYALYHVGYGMAPAEMLFLLGLGVVYAVAYAVARNILVIWPLLTPLGGFFANVAGGDIELPMAAILGFADVLGLMALAVFLASRWRRRQLARDPGPIAAG